jgi:imidazole glycerol phosphate synthase subunit HisF
MIVKTRIIPCLDVKVGRSGLNRSSFAARTGKTTNKTRPFGYCGADA